MASFLTGKSKRKGFDEVYDDFSSLSLSAPAAKIRRLDAELLPIIEMRESVGWPVFEHQQLEGFACDAVADAPQINMTPILSPAANEEKALVLYKPLHPQFIPSLQMDPKLISDLRNSAFRPGNRNLIEEDFVEDQQPSSANRLAVIPWAPSAPGPNVQASASMNAAVEENTMDLVEDSEPMVIEGELEQPLGAGAGGFRQCQQHRMILELSHITSTPALGSW